MIFTMKAGAPFIGLGIYQPGKGNYRGSIIGPAILERLKPFDLTPLDDPIHGPQETATWCSVPDHAEVRRFAQPDGPGRGWHQDGDTTPGSRMDHAAVVWAAVAPTEFRTADKTIYRPKPFEIVIARNLGCHHRTPPDAPDPPERRWFFRQRVEVPDWLKE